MTSLEVRDPRCEYRSEPLGVDEHAPRFSWTLACDRRGARQASYRIRVERVVVAGAAVPVWDSGVVASAATAHVAYAGAPLAPRSRYAWRVEVADDAAAAAAAASWFETGALGDAWRASWIGLAPAHDDERSPCIGARWLRAVGGGDAGFAQFVGDFTLPAAPRRALLVAYAPYRANKPRREQIVVNGATSPRWRATLNVRGQASPHVCEISGALRAGANRLGVQCDQIADGAVAVAVHVELADGSTRIVAKDARWRARVAPDDGEEGAWSRDADGWPAAIDVGAFGSGPWPADHAANRAAARLFPPALLRRAFRVERPVARARLYATACGVYEARLNGAKIGDEELAPGWTTYHRRLHYQVHDVTAAIRVGDNVLAAEVADGWFSGQICFGADVWGMEKALLAELRLTYADGTEDVIATGGAWRGATGATRWADLFLGEVVDATRARPGWDAPGCDERGWRAVTQVAPRVGILAAQPQPPVRATATLQPLSIVERAPGTWLIDFGQNLVGRVRLRAAAPRGALVVVRHGEVLDADGSLYVDNLRIALAEDVYRCRGDGVETLEPRFTFHGFRYAEVSGLASPPLADDVAAIVLNSDCAWTGRLSMSDPLLDRLQANIRWGQRGNFLAVPTDCPQRDERAGWTGDAQLFAPTATLNMDCATFLAKYVDDMIDSRAANGDVGDVAPLPKPMDAGYSAWSDALVVIPWVLWQAYGDTRVAERAMPAMRAWVDRRSARAGGGLDTAWSYGDWLSPDPVAPNEVISPMWHAHVARLVARLGEAVGDAAVARRYDAEADRLAALWAAAHLRDDGAISSDTQTAYALALRFGLVPERLRDAVARRLADAVARAGGHLATGFVGTPHLLPALSLAGRDDLAHVVLAKRTYPSWLFSVVNGATTIWERWDGWTPERGPHGGSMNSFNHYAFGAVGEWLFAHVGGIAAEAPGWARVRVRPRPGGGLTHASVAYRSIAGEVRCAWRIDGDRFRCEIELPANVVGEVVLPTRDPASVREGGAAVATRAVDGGAAIAIGAGRWSFSAAYAPG